MLCGLFYVVPTLRVMKASGTGSAHPKKASICCQMNSVADTLC